MAFPIKENIRKPVIWAVSISKLRQLFQDTAPSYADVADIRIIDKGFDEALATVREIVQAGEGDVFVGAGSNGAYLRSHLNAPVVLIQVSGFDVMHALAKARQISDRVAIVTYETVSEELAQFNRLYGADIVQRVYTTADDAKACVSELAAAGVRVIVGPGLVTDLAEQAGIIGIFLYSQNAVREALDRAVELARVARIEEARRERLNTILRHLAEGVVAVDMDERVQSFNPAMEKLLGISAEQAIGRRLSELAPELTLERTLRDGVTDLEDIERIGNKTIVANRIPVREQGVQTGAVLTYQDSTAIQRVDRSIRSQVRPRHLMAKYHLLQIVGDSPVMRELKTLAEKYARTDATVLITGESGTGKELLGQGIHNASRRKKHPFVAINCAAFPESLLESELFGYEEGAFTGSRRGGKAGLFEAAHTGTIFLDEIGDMPIALQTRLLRVLQEKEVLRLGGTDPTPVDVRVIAATNRNLRESVADGDFREDLYYRLNILHLHLPPLRERRQDIQAMARLLMRDALERQGSAVSGEGLVSELLPWFERYTWPGNVRELENITERLAVFFSDADERALDTTQLQSVVPELFQQAAESIEVDGGRDLKSRSKATELAHILRTIDECGGNQAEACRRLGIGRTTLWRKLNGRRAP